MNLAKESGSTSVEQDQIRSQLAQIYTPGVPITDPKLFSGRTKLLDSLRDQLAIPGKVFILYGERGVGKTSFYNVLLHRRKFVRYSCTSKDTFITIFLNILRSLGEHLTETEIKSLVEAGYEVGTEGVFKGTGKISDERTVAPLAPEPLDQASVLRRLVKVQRRVDAIVFDEFQELKDQDVQQQMSNLVKALSDNRITVRVFFVGIADSDEVLLRPSIDYSEYKMRHYMAVKIPRMSISELEDIIERRRNIYNIEFEPEVKKEIAAIASGYPSIAHTLALYACFAWLKQNAGKLVKNWLAKVPFGIGKLLQSQGLKVETIDLQVSSQEFSEAVRQFSTEFSGNYPKQAGQLIIDLSLADSLLTREIYLQLASAEEVGVSSEDLAEALSVEEDRVKEVVSSKSELIVQDAGTGNWRLAFSYLRASIRAYDYLLRQQPEQ